LIKSVQLLDFLSHSNTKIEFDEGVTVFVGPNGSGKSSIIDAITFGLFGKHMRNNKKGLVRDGANQGQVSIEFSANGKIFKAVRTINTNGALIARFYEIIDGNDVLIAEGERSKVGDNMTKAVESKLGLSFEKIKIASIVQQGELDYIIKAKPKEFKELLNSVISIDKLDLAFESMKEVQKNFHRYIQDKFEYDETQINFVKKKTIEFENNIKESKPLLEKLELEREKQEKSILQFQIQIEKNNEIELQSKEFESCKKELVVYLLDAIKQYEVENNEKKQKIADCEECFKFVQLKNKTDSEIQNIDLKLELINEKITKLEKKSVQLNEQKILAEKLELKDGKCPVCNSKVDHLNPLFQKKHIEQEISSMKTEISQLIDEQQHLNLKEVNLNETFEKAKESEIILKTHNIQNKNQLEQIQKEIKTGDELIKKIQNSLSSENITESVLIDSHAKKIFEKMLRLKKLTKNIDKEQFFIQKQNLGKCRHKLNLIYEEHGALKQKLNNSEKDLTKLTETIKELEIVKDYVTQLDQIQNIVFYRDGPVAKSLRSWALDTISYKATQYIEMLNTKIDRIRLTEKTRNISIICKKKTKTFDIDSLSGGEQVCVAIALRLGMAHLLGSSKLNFMILDEPTTHLDSERRKELVKVLSQISNLKNSDSKIPLQLIIITHDSEIFENSVVENIYDFKSTSVGTKIEPINRL